MAMGGIDAIVFTGGIGENSNDVRALVLKDAEWLGIQMDKEKNDSAHGKELDISTPDSKVKVLVIPTTEELVIAQDTKKIVEKDVTT